MADDDALWRILGNLEAMVKDIREGQPARNAALAKLEQRLDDADRKLADWNKDLSAQLKVVQAGVDGMRVDLGDVSQRLGKIEAPALRAATERAAWRGRLARTLAKITAAALFAWALAEPIYRGVMERAAALWFDRGGH